MGRTARHRALRLGGPAPVLTAWDLCPHRCVCVLAVLTGLGPRTAPWRVGEPLRAEAEWEALRSRGDASRAGVDLALSLLSAPGSRCEWLSHEEPQE